MQGRSFGEWLWRYLIISLNFDLRIVTALFLTPQTINWGLLQYHFRELYGTVITKAGKWKRTVHGDAIRGGDTLSLSMGEESSTIILHWQGSKDKYPRYAGDWLLTPECLSTWFRGTRITKPFTFWTTGFMLEQFVESFSIALSWEEE